MNSITYERMVKTIRLSEIAYHKIKSMIMNGGIKSRYITQNELVKELNMSRTPIVSALQILSNEGFITIESKKGIIIKELSIKEINELYDMRIALEGYSIRNISEDSIIDFQRLEQIICEQKEYIKNKDIYNFARTDSIFHQELLKINDNKTIIKANKTIGERLFFHKTLVSKNVYLDDFVSDHIKIIEALKNQDFTLAGTILEKHIQSGKISF